MNVNYAVSRSLVHSRAAFDTWDGDELEGYVVRLAGAFAYGAFRRAAAKYVRAGHDQTRAHWWQGQTVVRNELATDANV